MNSSNSFDSPMRSQGNFGEFPKPQFSPMFTSSPRCRNEASDFIPFGPSSPGPTHTRGRWRGHNRSYLSNTSSSGQSSNFSPNMSPRSTPYRQNSPRGHWRGRGNKGNSWNYSQNQIKNISSYFHPSMLEDPWAELEKKLPNSNSFCCSSTKKEVENKRSDTESSVKIEQTIETSFQESVS